WMKGPQVTAVTGSIGSAAMPCPHFLEPADRKSTPRPRPRAVGARAAPQLPPSRRRAQARPPPPAPPGPWTTSAVEGAVLPFAFLSCRPNPEGARTHGAWAGPDDPAAHTRGPG